ncbi:acyltransferase domain-containing protein [Nocardia sp. SYP-A9097]|uniref:acyltransferase domain-containing protein n=1 Tax=Nocardia sp. SYP-A9097 TaxID=2663237 RepID=UPI00129AEB1A|nr:acyltransferase domain-containing protein [Nocardia sp. SYP-A9097]MRH92065.1 acyltransferase domain-containing protein [Nocardia sp. SYP-A9097]
MADNTAFMFPGQGAYLETVFTDLAAHRREVREVFDEIDGALSGSADSVSPILFNSTPALEMLLAEDPDTLQLALYGTAVAINRILAGEGIQPSALVGHSLGEIAALVAAKAFSVGDGAIIVARRNAALRAAAPAGGMLALSVGVQRASALIDAIDDPGLAVAVVNSPRQVVVSGPASSLAMVADLAGRIGIPTAPLSAPYPFHNPLLAEAAVLFESGIRPLRSMPLHRRVYSPILGRQYTDGDDLPSLLAGHLTRRVDFAKALQHLFGTGIDRFVECGARNALTGLVGKTLPNVTALATVPSGVSPIESMLAVTGRVDSPETSRRTTIFSVRATPALVPVPALVPAPAPVLDQVTPTDRARLLEELAELYAEAVEYPTDVFAEDVDLEGDLGIDSVKQTELMQRVAAKYGLPALSDDFRISEHGTLGRIADIVARDHVSV